MSQPDSTDDDFIAGPADSQHLPNDEFSTDDPEGSASSSSYSLLLDYPSEPDYYALLGLSRTPPPSESDIRSAFRSRTLSFHPDHQPAHRQAAAARYFDQLRRASETLLDHRKRTVYDFLGEEGVRREWEAHGSMGRFGEGKEVGVRAMKAGEFREWFLETMKRRERRVVQGLVGCRSSLTLGIDASHMVALDADEDDVVYFAFEAPRVSDIALKYSFKAPFPSPRVLFGDEQKDDEDEDEDDDEDKPPGKSNKSPYESDGPTMLIQTGISGPLQPIYRKYKLAMEDGEIEEHEVAEPPLLTARSLTLGATVTHVFGELAGSKGILGWRPFSFLSYTGASVNAMLLPAPLIQAQVAKGVQIVPGTKPFRVNLSTTLMHSIFRCLPILGVQVTREIGAGKHTFCNWSSGIVPWPDVLKVLLSPIGDFNIDVDTALYPGNPDSRLEFGFMKLPNSPLNAATLNDDDDDKYEEEEEDEEFTVTRKKQIAEDKAAESWQAAIVASPLTTGLSFTYARNLFSGKPANEVARSEWSSENHYALPAADEPRAVRLEIQTTVNPDLSMGWNIEGTRQVGDLTRMGLGVGLQGTKGLSVTVSWGRLGQRIRLPITLIPLEALDADLAALAVIFPFASYCAWEFGFIRPRDRKNRRRVIARRQKQLKKSIPKKRAESAQAIALMAEQVQRRQAKEADQNGLVILKAEYGLDSSKIDRTDRKDRWSGYQAADVTIPVAALVNRGQLVISKDMTKFHILGFYDPAPLLPKTLKIWYTYHGKDHYVQANDAEGIACPMRTHLL